MRPALHARLQNREPQPGLLNLPIPVPSVPVLSPVLAPIVGGSNPGSTPQPPASQPAPQPAPQPVPAPPSQQPPGAGSGGSPPANGHSPPPSSGSGGSPPGNGHPPPPAPNPPSEAPGSGGSPPGNGHSPPPSSGNGGSGTPSGSGGSSGSPQATSNSAPSLLSSGTSPESGSGGSLSANSGTAVKVTSTGIAALPLNNEAATPSSGSAPGQFSSATKASGSPIVTAGSLGAPDSSLGSPGASQGGGGGGSGSGSNDANNTSSASSHSHLSSGAIGGIVATLVVIFALSIFFVLRKRYNHHKAERQVKWINGYVTGETSDMQETQRCTSMRSSWGTPVEHRFSDPFRWSTPKPIPNMQETYHDAESPHAYHFSDSGAPVLPMPVHSPIEARSYSPENPFADGNTSPQPIRRMSSLPIRVSLISTGSGTRDPFDDVHGYRIDDDVSESGGTFGRGSGFNHHVAHETQANFPMPPPTPGSSTSGLAIGSPSDLLQLPGILISFPDSPVSPTFAASGTSSYPRRASVKLPFKPSQERRDEILLEKGDQVNVVSVYEDGWGFIQNERNNERGLVPLNCLEIDNP